MRTCGGERRAGQVPPVALPAKTELLFAAAVRLIAVWFLLLFVLLLLAAAARAAAPGGRGGKLGTAAAEGAQTEAFVGGAKKASNSATAYRMRA